MANAVTVGDVINVDRSSTDALEVTGSADLSVSLKVAGTKVVGAQGAHIADPAACAAATQNALTDNGGGTADATVEDVADIALDTTDTYTDSAVNTAVNAAIASVSNNFKEMTTELALVKTDIAACITAIGANNTAIDSILSRLETHGLLASA